MDRRRGRTAVLAACGAAALVLASVTACGVGGEGGTGGYGAAGQAPAAAGAGGAGDAGGRTVLKLAEAASIGEIVTDGAGLTLYRFDSDTPNPSASACKGECAAQWPPVLVEGQVTTEGVDQSLVGKIKRPDGGWQVTLGGWPLYRYAGDAAPGDVNGEGFAGKWFSVAPDGMKAVEHARTMGKGARGSGAGGSSGAGGGY